MAAETVVVGIDLGTSAVKVLAVTVAGREVASGAEAYALETPHPLMVEQDVEAVYLATMRVLQRVLADVAMRGDELAAIGFSSAMHGVICVDERGEPISHLITWMDRRAGAIADAWRHDGTADALYRETGAPMHPMLPVAKLRWLADNDAALFAKTARFVGLKELFVFRWTGEWLVDWGIAAATGLFAFESRSWSERALQAAGIESTRLSKPAAPSTKLTNFRPSVSRELGLHAGVALVLASSDGALANIGSGASTDDLAVTLGTSGAVRTLTTTPMLDERGRTFCYIADDTRYVVGGPTSSAGASLDWIFALLLDEFPKPERFAHAVELAETIAPGSDGCTVLPFLSGERAPYWESSLRGAFAGLELAHDRRTLLRASFEGVVFGLFAVYDVVRERTGHAGRMLLSGGLTKAALVRGMLADVFDLPAVQPHQQEASAFGAALLAAQGCGLIPDASTAARATGYDEPRRPDPATAAAYREAFTRYHKLVETHLPPPRSS